MAEDHPKEYAQETIELASRLIECPSVTPNDASCQKIIRLFLKELGFQCHDYSHEDVTNTWAVWGEGSPVFVLAGHTDVVPPGNLSDWKTQPFTPTIKNNILYGRGAADMKGNLAAMLVAAKHFLNQSSPKQGTLAFLITSDEEGTAQYGTRYVIEQLKKHQQPIDYCIVGEPSSQKKAGDTIRIGRRGSLSCHLTIIGKQGHVAYPELAKNPIHLALPFLDALKNIVWDQGNQHFPQTSFQISNIQAGVGANNVIPATLEVDFNIRFSTESSFDSLKSTIYELLDQHQLTYDINWHESGSPFLTEHGKLIQCAQKSIEDITGMQTICSTSGGTSDGRFIARTEAEIIELGVCNATIHQSNECVSLDDLYLVTQLYMDILSKIYD